MQQWQEHGSYDLVSDEDTQGAVGLWASADLLPQGSQLQVAPTLGFTGAGTSASVRGAFNSSLDTWDLLAGAQVRYRLLPWLSPHLRVLGGAKRSTFRLSSDDTDTRNWRQRDWTAMVRAGAGFGIYLPRDRHRYRRGPWSTLSFGLELEFGVSLAPAMQLELSTTDLGSIKRRAAYGALSFVVRR